MLQQSQSRDLRLELCLEGNICVGQSHSILLKEGNEPCMSTMYRYTLNRYTSCYLASAFHQVIVINLFSFFCGQVDQRVILDSKEQYAESFLLVISFFL